MDQLPDRTADTLARWFTEHSGIDRALECVAGALKLSVAMGMAIRGVLALQLVEGDREITDTDAGGMGYRVRNCHSRSHDAKLAQSLGTQAKVLSVARFSSMSRAQRQVGRSAGFLPT